MRSYNRLDIAYQLVNGADHTIMPDPVTANGLSIVYLKTRKTIDLAYNRILQVPTGIMICQFPVIELESSPPISMATIARCESIPELEEEEGLSVLGPKIISSDRLGEIIVTIKNNSKTIFHAERGEPIAMLTFDLMPMIDFTIIPQT